MWPRSARVNGRKKQFAKGCRGLKGRTLGLLGMGNIGAEVAKRAQAFDMNVVAWDISLTPERAAHLGVTQADGPVRSRAASRCFQCAHCTQ